MTNKPLVDFATRKALRLADLTLRPMRKLRAKMELAHKKRHCLLEPGAMLFPKSRVLNNQSRESIHIGRNTRVLATLHTFGHGGNIKIGEYCFVGLDSNIWSASSISIGDRVLISHGVNIHDTNAHSMSAKERHQHFLDIFTSGHPESLDDVPTRPIVIEDDAWIGFGATILKGVTIGKGAVVGACTVVTKDVAPYTVVIGNPAKKVGESLP